MKTSTLVTSNPFAINATSHTNQVPLLRRGGHVTQQELYTDLTKDIMPRMMGEGISFEDEDLAALRIQSMYRGKLGKKRYEAELEGWKRRDRAALRVQCAWRGRQGYSKMLLMRAKKYDEDEAAIRLQSMMRAKHDRKRYIHTRAFMSQQEIMATRIQCAYRGRRDRLRMQQRSIIILSNFFYCRREKGSLIATTTQWGESENGLALLVDLGGFKTKFSFNNVMTVKGQGPGAKVGLGASSRGHRMNERHLDEPSRDEDNIDDDLLEELKGESSSLAKQLARIEVMAEELEEDFARTGSELYQFKKAMGEGLREDSIRQLNSRMNLVDYENEMIRKRQAEKDKENRRRSLGDGGGGGKKKG
ncbi:hypothetical protein TL16_g11586, partial [Triparma laevis f. inornata]